MNGAGKERTPGVSRLEKRWNMRSQFERAPGGLVDLVNASPSRVLAKGGAAEIYKTDGTTTVARLRTNDGDYIIKHYKPRNAWHRIKRALRLSRARRCWRMANEFSDSGIGTGRRVGYIEQRWGPFCGDSYYICEHIDGESCMDWLPQQDRSTWEDFAEKAAIMFHCLEQNSLAHGDMKASNLIWSAGNLYVIDLDAACRPRSRLRRQYLLRRDQQRFMQNWGEVPQLLALLQDRLGFR